MISLRSYFNNTNDNNRPANVKKPVYFWGSNVYGLANPGENNPSAIIKHPHQCFFWSEQGLEIVELCAAERHAACIDSNGDLWQWGEDVSNKKSSKPIRTLTGKKLVHITCNDQIILASSAVNDEIFVVPVNLNEQKNERIRVECPEPLTSLKCGHDHVLGLSRTGKLFTAAINTCGNEFGQLGIGLIATYPSISNGDNSKNNIKQSDKEEDATPLRKSSVVSDWPRETPTNFHNFKNSSNEVYPERQLHDPISFQHIPMPESITDIAAGSHYSLVLGESGKVYAFGSNSNLQLGLGKTAPTVISTPTAIPTLKDITSVAAAGNTSFYLANNQNSQSVLYAAGNGLYGQLGIGSYHHAVGEPTLISAVSHQFYFDEVNQSKRPISIRGLWVGPNNAAVLMDTFHPERVKYSDQEKPLVGYDVLAWGCNKHYQIHPTSHANIPAPVTLRPASPSSTLVDYTDLALSSEGPTTINPEGTLSFLGGQLQVLPDKEGKPAHKLFVASEFSCLY